DGQAGDAITQRSDAAGELVVEDHGLPESDGAGAAMVVIMQIGAADAAALAADQHLARSRRRGRMVLDPQILRGVNDDRSHDVPLALTHPFAQPSYPGRVGWQKSFRQPH